MAWEARGVNGYDTQEGYDTRGGKFCHGGVSEKGAEVGI